MTDRPQPSKKPPTVKITTEQLHTLQRGWEWLEEHKRAESLYTAIRSAVMALNVSNDGLALQILNEATEKHKYVEPQ